MSQVRRNVSREILLSILFQVLRGLLFGWTARLIAKGYLTSGQAEYILIGVVSILATAIMVVCTSVYRFARSEALKHSSANATPENVKQLMWQILWQLLNIQPLKEPNENETSQSD